MFKLTYHMIGFAMRTIEVALCLVAAIPVAIYTFLEVIHDRMGIKIANEKMIKQSSESLQNALDGVIEKAAMDDIRGCCGRHHE